MPLARPKGVLISNVVLKSPIRAWCLLCDRISLWMEEKPRSAICVSIFNAEFLFRHKWAHRPAPGPVTSRLISCPAVLLLRADGGVRSASGTQHFPPQHNKLSLNLAFTILLELEARCIHVHMFVSSISQHNQPSQHSLHRHRKRESLAFEGPDALMQVQNFLWPLNRQ
jgi:hypothetical protein